MMDRFYLLVTFLFILGISLVSTQYVFFEDNNVLANMLFSGGNGQPPFTDFYKIDFIGWENIIGWLYTIFPTTPWYGYIIYSFTWICIGILLFNVYLRITRQENIHSSLFPFVLILVSATYSITQLHHNRVAFLLCGSALFTVFNKRSFGKFGATFYFLLLNYLLFFIGALLRPDAGLGTILLMVPIFFMLGLPSNRISILKGQFAFTAIAILVFGYTQWHTYTTKSYHTSLEPNLEYEILEKRNVVPLSEMKTGADSARYLAAKSWFIADSAGLPISFLKSIILKNNAFQSRSVYFLNGIKSIKEIRYEVEILVKSSKYLWLIFTGVCIWASFLMFSFIPLFVYLWVICLVVYMSAAINAVARNVDPMLLLSITVVLLSIVQYREPFNKKYTIIEFLVSILLFLGMSYWVIAQKKQKDIVVANNKHLYETIKNSSYKNVFLLVPLEYYPISPFFNPKLLDGKHLPIIEFGQYIHTAQGKKMVASSCGCKNEKFIDRFDALKLKGDLLIVSTEVRLDLYKYYLKKVYDYDFNVTKINCFDDRVCFFKLKSS